MAFDFNKLKSDIVSMGKDVGDKVSDASAVAKVKLDIHNKESYMEKQFTESVSESLVAVEGSNSKDFSIRMEGDSRTRIICFSHNVDRCKRLTLGELLNEDFAFPVHLGAEIVGKCVHAADTHSVQTS